MRAVLDLGTNTFHLLIARIVAGEVKEIYQKQIPVKIGSGGINQGHIAADAYERGMQALATFHQELSQYPIQSIVATGTSAIRHAGNGKDFIKEAKERFGFTIESISGDLEAELIYTGVSKSFAFPDEAVLVMDIGGGSVEFIIGKKENIIWKQSFETGAARLLDRFQPADPIRTEEIQAIEKHLDQILKPLKDALDQARKEGQAVHLLIGSAGSFETLLDVLRIDLNQTYPSPTPFAHEVSQEQFNLFCQTILRAGIKERQNLKGLVDFRIDMIVVATVLMQYVQKRFGLNRIVASNYALKEGLLFYQKKDIG